MPQQVPIQIEKMFLATVNRDVSRLEMQIQGKQLRN